MCTKKSVLATGRHPTQVREELEQGITASAPKDKTSESIFQIKVARLAQIIRIFMFIFQFLNIQIVRKYFKRRNNSEKEEMCRTRR